MLDVRSDAEGFDIQQCKTPTKQQDSPVWAQFPFNLDQALIYGRL